MSEPNDQPGGESSGLLDSVTVEDPSKPANPQAAEIPHLAGDTTATAAAPAATAAPGDDKPPEWMPENFLKDGKPDYEALAKSWRDLRGKISKGAHNAPADGKYNLSAFGDKGDENPIGQTLAGWAKENGISAAAFEELTDKISAQAQEIMSADMIDPKAEMAKLGPNGNAVVNSMVDWARGMVNKGVWDKEDFEEFKIMGGTARGLQALMKLRGSLEGRVPIETMPMDGAPTKEELQQMVADPKYKTDAAYRQKVERLFNQVYSS